jgi:GNAT superfamily N-acetyltransferase
MTKSIAVREMLESDCPTIAGAFAAQGWDKPLSQYLGYWREGTEDKRLVLVAELDGRFAGYLTIVWESDYPPFREAGIPEITDFNVLVEFRRQHIGSVLMAEAENRIGLRARAAGLGVCLHADYGAAQVLYAKRGYVPDGRGVYYHGIHPKQGGLVRLDDDLCLYLTKQVR